MKFIIPLIAILFVLGIVESRQAYGESPLDGTGVPPGHGVDRISGGQSVNSLPHTGIEGPARGLGIEGPARGTGVMPPSMRGNR